MFVETDVAEKRSILRTLHEYNPIGYHTIRSMVHSELVEPPVAVPAAPKAEGSRTLLRLHRALTLLLSFIESVEAADEGASVPELFRRSYASTLAHHHTWLIRKSVSLASHTLPSRVTLLDRIFEAVEDEKERDLAARDFSATLHAVYSRVQDIYTEFSLLDLP